jgi:hypothetical protein
VIAGAGLAYHRTMRNWSFGNWFSGVTAALLVSAAGLLSAPAHADEFTARANEPFKAFGAARRTDLVVLPLLAKLEPVPSAVRKLEDSALVFPGIAGWDEAVKWAAGAAQQDAVKSLAKVTAEKDWRKANAFAQPYGLDGVEIPMIQAGMYTDLGDPPTLAGAKVGFLPALDSLAIQVNVEATRLTHEGKVGDAIELLLNYVYFSRQMCDRQLFVEVNWGLTHMLQGIERIRDVLHTDLVGKNSLDTAKISGYIERLDDKSSAYLDLARVRFPDGDRAAAEQLVSRMYPAGSALDEQVFATTMSRLTSTTRPLRLFGESGKWRSVGSSQGNKSEAVTQAGAIFDDWKSRWDIPLFDNRLTVKSAYELMDRSKFAALAAVVPNMATLSDLRTMIRVELLGGRQSLAVLGFRKTISNFPPQISSVRPAWLKDIQPDPLNPARANGARPPFQYFVPIRDTEHINGVGKPHEMDVVMLGRPFKVVLKEDQFVLASVGSDYASNNAKRIQNTTEVVQGADYLVWPPLTSLYRQYLLDVGDLK